MRETFRMSQSAKRVQWQCFVLRAPNRQLRMVRDKLLPTMLWLERQPNLRFNFNTYKGPDPHLSLRVSREPKGLRARLEKLPAVVTVQPYTEKRDVALAYEAGTRAYLVLAKQLGPSPPMNCVLQAAHGLRDNVGCDSPRNEARDWLWLAGRLMAEEVE